MKGLRTVGRLAAGILAAVLLATVAVQGQGGWARYLKLTLGDACTITTGANTPEAAVTGSICDLFLRTNGGTATTLYVKESGTATNTGWVPASGARTERVWMPAAICDHNTGHSLFNAGTGASYATDNCDVGTNAIFGDFQFPDTGTTQAQTNLYLPPEWTGQIDVEFVWYAGVNTNAVVWQLQTACSGDAQTNDPAWNAAQTVTDTAAATINYQNRATITNVTTTGCTAGKILRLKILRDPANAADTLAATADLVGIVVTYRRAG